MTTSWTKKSRQGETWLAGQDGLNAGDETFNGLVVWAGFLPDFIDWSNQAKS